MRPYVIRQGDYLTKLAHMIGFNADATWNDEANRTFRERRPDPDILAPGDVLHVPAEPTATPHVLMPDSENEFKARLPKVKVSIVFRHEGAPLEDAPYVLEGLAKRVLGRSDRVGVVTFEVPVHVREVRVTFYEKQLAFPVRVGDLDPIDETSGVQQRLMHLGFDGWALGEAAGLQRPLPEDGDTSAIRAFQRTNALEETGEMDEMTRATLKKAHGG